MSERSQNSPNTPKFARANPPRQRDMTLHMQIKTRFENIRGYLSRAKTVCQFPGAAMRGAQSVASTAEVYSLVVLEARGGIDDTDSLGRVLREGLFPLDTNGQG